MAASDVGVASESWKGSGYMIEALKTFNTPHLFNKFMKAGRPRAFVKISAN